MLFVGVMSFLSTGFIIYTTFKTGVLDLNQIQNSAMLALPFFIMFAVTVNNKNTNSNKVRKEEEDNSSKSLLDKLEAAMKPFMPESATETNIGRVTSTRTVDGGGFLSSIKTEVIVGEAMFVVLGSVNGEKKGENVTLREWIQTGGTRYLIIKDNKYSIVE